MNRPPLQPMNDKETLDYLQRLTQWLTDAYKLLSEYEKKKVVRRTAINYTTTVDDFNIAVTNTDAARTITIASAFIAIPDAIITVSDESGGAAANNITVATEGAETIYGGATIAANYGSLKYRTDGSDLFTIE